MHWGHAHTREAVTVNINSWKGRLYTRNGLPLLSFLFSTPMRRVKIMVVIIDVSVKHGSFWSIRNINVVLSDRAVGPAWTWNSRTDNPRIRFYVSLATRIFHLPWMKTSCFLHSNNRATADGSNFAPAIYFTDLVSTRCKPINLLSVKTILVCTFTSFINGKWQSVGLPVIPFPLEGIVNKAVSNHFDFPF